MRPGTKTVALLCAAITMMNPVWAADPPAAAASAHPLRRPSGYVQLGWASYVYAVSRRAGEVDSIDVISATTGDVSGPVRRLYTVR